jgi:hypothetical protein
MKRKKIRKQVPWNTGERVHQPKKGKGSYTRKVKNDRKNKNT